MNLYYTQFVSPIYDAFRLVFGVSVSTECRESIQSAVSVVGCSDYYYYYRFNSLLLMMVKLMRRVNDVLSTLKSSVRIGFAAATEALAPQCDHTHTNHTPYGMHEQPGSEYCVIVIYFFISSSQYFVSIRLCESRIS